MKEKTSISVKQQRVHEYTHKSQLTLTKEQKQYNKLCHRTKDPHKEKKRI